MPLFSFICKKYLALLEMRCQLNDTLEYSHRPSVLECRYYSETFVRLSSPIWRWTVEVSSVHTEPSSFSSLHQDSGRTRGPSACGTHPSCPCVTDEIKEAVTCLHHLVTQQPHWPEFNIQWKPGMVENQDRHMFQDIRDQRVSTGDCLIPAFKALKETLALARPSFIPLFLNSRSLGLPQVCVSPWVK